MLTMKTNALSEPPVSVVLSPQTHAALRAVRHEWESDDQTIARVLIGGTDAAPSAPSTPRRARSRSAAKAKAKRSRTRTKAAATPRARQPLERVQSQVSGDDIEAAILNYLHFHATDGSAAPVLVLQAITNHFKDRLTSQELSKTSDGARRTRFEGRVKKRSHEMRAEGLIAPSAARGDMNFGRWTIAAAGRERVRSQAPIDVGEATRTAASTYAPAPGGDASPQVQTAETGQITRP